MHLFNESCVGMYNHSLFTLSTILTLYFLLSISYATGRRPAGISHIHCHGNETHLLQCSHRNDSNDHCDKFDQIGLQCSEWCSGGVVSGAVSGAVSGVVSGVVSGAVSGAVSGVVSGVVSGAVSGVVSGVWCCQWCSEWCCQWCCQWSVVLSVVQ